MTSVKVHDASINLNSAHDELFTAVDAFESNIDLDSVWTEPDNFINFDNYKEYVSLRELQNHYEPILNVSLQYVEIEDVQSFANQSSADGSVAFGTALSKKNEPKAQDVILIDDSQLSCDAESDVDIIDCSSAESVHGEPPSVEFVSCNDVFSSDPESSHWPIVEVVSKWGSRNMSGDAEIKWTAVQIDDNGFVRPLNENVNLNNQNAKKSSASKGQTDDICVKTLSVGEWLRIMNKTTAFNSSTNPTAFRQDDSDYHQFHRANSSAIQTLVTESTSSINQARLSPVSEAGYDSTIDVEALSDCDEQPIFVNPMQFIHNIHNYCQPLQTPSKDHRSKRPSSSSSSHSMRDMELWRRQCAYPRNLNEMLKGFPSTKLNTDLDRSEEDEESLSDSSGIPASRGKSQLRDIHNTREKVRRNNMRAYFSKLRDVIPFLAGNNKASKDRILKAAVEFINWLKAEEKANLVKLNREKSKRILEAARRGRH